LKHFNPACWRLKPKLLWKQKKNASTLADILKLLEGYAVINSRPILEQDAPFDRANHLNQTPVVGGTQGAAGSGS